MFNAKKHHAPSTKRLLVSVVTILLVSVVSQAAFASPIDDKRKKAQKLVAEIEANGDKISLIAEKYNDTRIQLDGLKDSVYDAKVQLKAAEDQNREVKARVQQRAVAMYSESSVNKTAVENKADSIRKDRYAEIAAGNDSDTLNQLVVTKETVSERKDELEKQLSSISDQEKALEQQQKSLTSANARQKELLNQTKGELATLISNEQRAREARANAAASKIIRKSKKAKSGQAYPKNLPAPSARASVAIAFARRQLGKPYRWAAAGPNSYDCSGLIMAAYGSAGLSLPHSSSGQYSKFPKVPLSELKPGDLVYRPGHIGLYIGNGLMIHAPHTGDVVKISPIRKVRGASRPG